MEKTVEIREQDFNSFFEVPFKIYPKDFPFVSELKSDLKRFLSTKNPIFRDPTHFSYFTAFRDRKPVGRIVTHIHQASNERYNWKKAYFGYFDVEDNIETAKALLSKAEEFGRKHRCTEVVGNFNLTAMQKAGVLTEFFVNNQYTDQIVNPLYTPELLKACGYTPCFPMQTFEMNLNAFDENQLLGAKQKELLKSSDYTFEHLNKKNVDECLETMRLCLNDGMDVHSWYVPLTEEEMYFQAKDLMLIIDEKISVFARHKGKPIGAYIAIPNLNPFLRNIRSRYGLTTPYYFMKHNRTCDTVVGIIYSVFKQYHDIGVNGAMLYLALKNMKERGYKKMGGTWIGDDNTASLRQIQKLGAYPMHRLHLFRKEIQT
jgi:hypothetical protein